jgi:hypothetical protein
MSHFDFLNNVFDPTINMTNILKRMHVCICVCVCRWQNRVQLLKLVYICKYVLNYCNHSPIFEYLHFPPHMFTTHFFTTPVFSLLRPKSCQGPSWPPKSFPRHKEASKNLRINQLESIKAQKKRDLNFFHPVFLKQ